MTVDSRKAFYLGFVAGVLPLIGLVPAVPISIWATGGAAVVLLVLLVVNDRWGFRRGREMPRSGEAPPGFTAVQQLVLLGLLLMHFGLTFYIIFHDYWKYAYVLDR